MADNDDNDKKEDIFDRAAKAADEQLAKMKAKIAQDNAQKQAEAESQSK